MLKVKHYQSGIKAAQVVSLVGEILYFPSRRVVSSREAEEDLSLSNQQHQETSSPQVTSWFSSAFSKTTTTCQLTKPSPQKSLQNDANRLGQQQALPHQRHAPLHSSRQQHGRDHHGSQPAARRAPGGACSRRDGAQQQQQQQPPRPRRRQPGTAVPQQAEGHVRALPAPQVHKERHGVGSAEEGDERRRQLPGDGGEAGGGQRRGAASRRQLGPGEPVSLSPQGTVWSSVQAHVAGRPPHQPVQEGNRRRKLHEIEVTKFFLLFPPPNPRTA